MPGGGEEEEQQGPIVRQIDLKNDILLNEWLLFWLLLFFLQEIGRFNRSLILYEKKNPIKSNVIAINQASRGWTMTSQRWKWTALTNECR